MKQNGFSTATLADAEIGLRASARLLNCPDATDDTIGIYAVTDTIMHKAMKALTLALVAAAAGRAQADLVVSALFGTEPPSYVHAAVTNVLSFTLPTTKIVVTRRVAGTPPRTASAPTASRARAASCTASRAWIPSISRLRMIRRTY